jgi:hypothetical protein
LFFEEVDEVNKIIIFLVSIILSACGGMENPEKLSDQEKLDRSEEISQQLMSCNTLDNKNCTGSFVFFSSGNIKRIVPGTNTKAERTIGMGVLQARINSGNLWKITKIVPHGSKIEGTDEWKLAAVQYMEQFVPKY